MATFWQNLFCRPHNQENPDDLLEGMKYYPAIKGLYTRHFCRDPIINQALCSTECQPRVWLNHCAAGCWNQKIQKKTWGHLYIQEKKMDNIFQLGVSKIRGTPKWMVYGKPLLKWIIWGYHYFRKHPVGGSSWWSSPTFCLRCSWNTLNCDNQGKCCMKMTRWGWYPRILRSGGELVALREILGKKVALKTKLPSRE